MKVLIINGSPKGEASNTFKITQSFVNGISKAVKCDIEIFSPYNSKNIHPCCGCYSCWEKTPGQCIYKDDMPLQSYVESDIIIWSFPLYYYSMPSQVKCVMDRLLPLVTPKIETKPDGSCYHPSRYDLHKKQTVLISTCGFCETDATYEALLKQFDLIYKDGYSSIICSEGELFRVEQVRERCDEYLQLVTDAGEEFGKSTKISENTQRKLAEKLFEPAAFMQMANASWDIEGISESKSLRLLKQMAAIYNKSYYHRDLVVDFNFSDSLEEYQLIITKEKCDVLTTDFKNHDLQINTTLKNWLEISNNEITGSQALLAGKYSVNGDIATLAEFGQLFKTARHNTGKAENIKNRSRFWVLLLPLLVFWNISPFSGYYGATLTLVVSAGILGLRWRYRFTIYDYITCGLGILFGICSLYSGETINIIILSYILYGILWGLSCIVSLPLTAYYAVNAYNEEMLENQIFIRTNLYTTLIWATAFIVAGIFYLISSSTVITNSIMIYSWIYFICIGIITQIFIRYYPEYVIKRKK